MTQPKRVKEIQEVLSQWMDSSDALEAAKSIYETSLTGEKKPLNATERRALEKLIDNDFNALKVEIRTMAAQVRNDREKEIKAEYAAKGQDIEKARKDTEALQRKFEDQLRKLRDDYRSRGIILNDDGGYHRGGEVALRMTYNHHGLKEAINVMIQEVQQDENNALRIAERQRVTVQRRVLLAAIGSAEALKLLDEIPDAKAMMLAAQEDVTKELAR